MTIRALKHYESRNKLDFFLSNIMEASTKEKIMRHYFRIAAMQLSKIESLFSSH